MVILALLFVFSCLQSITTGTNTGVTGVSDNAPVFTANADDVNGFGNPELLETGSNQLYDTDDTDDTGECEDGGQDDCKTQATCCDTVQLTSSDAIFLDHVCSIVIGTYTVNTSNPTSNNRIFYKHESGDWYLVYSGFSDWRVIFGGNYAYYEYTENYEYLEYCIKSFNTDKKCPHGGDIVWQYSGSLVDIPDSTMKFSCITACASDPPTPPSDRVSDWDGSTLTSGTVVTYTCTTGSCSPLTAVCDPQSLQWKTNLSSAPACDSCSTYCGLDGFTTFSIVMKTRGVATALECQEICAGVEGAEHFRWKKIKGKSCWCIATLVKSKKNFETGPVTC